MTIVLDASATLASFFRYESTPAISALFERVARIGAIAPAIWPLEVANGLQMAVRRSRVDAAFRSVALRDLAAFPIVLDSETSAAAWTTLPPIADLNGLTIYDAASRARVTEGRRFGVDRQETSSRRRRQWAGTAGNLKLAQPHRPDRHPFSRINLDLSRFQSRTFSVSRLS